MIIVLLRTHNVYIYIYTHTHVCLSLSRFRPVEAAPEGEVLEVV